MSHEHELIAGLRQRLAEAGLSGSFLVRNLDTGQEIGIGPDTPYPIASLAKLPLALAVLEHIRTGRLDGARVVGIEPGGYPSSASLIGLGNFRHRVAVAVEDLLYLAIAISDNVAADALFGLVPPAEVDKALTEAGITGITLRHPMRDLFDTPSDLLGRDGVHLAHAIAASARTAGGGHPVRQLDLTRANIGTAGALADLLQALWRPSPVHPDTAERMRALMRGGVLQRRLGPDFISDATRWASKSGTLMNLRHDVGVVEHEDGEVFAVVALTESAVPAAAQPAAEALIGRVARALHDRLRGGGPLFGAVPALE